MPSSILYSTKADMRMPHFMYYIPYVVLFDRTGNQWLWLVSGRPSCTGLFPCSTPVWSDSREFEKAALGRFGGSSQIINLESM